MEPKRFEPWPWAFVVFFLVVFTANGVLIYLSQSSWTGLITRDHYQKGLSYNQVLAAQKEQDALGWKMVVQTTPQGEVTVLLKDKQGEPISRAKMEGMLFRPTREGYDQAFTLTETSPGQYRATLHPELKGLWELRLQASTPKGKFHQAERITME